MNKFTLKLDSQNSLSLNPKKKRKDKSITNFSPMEEKFYESSKNQINSIILQRQYPIGKYFADFAYISDKLKLVIEIDGVKGHVNLKDRTNDYKRERFFISQGFIVLRFTGGEIYHSCGKCIKEMIEVIKTLENRK